MGSRSGDETVEIEGTVEGNTRKAVLVYDNMSGNQVWIPRSQIHNDWERTNDGNYNYTFRISEWFAKKEGLI